MLPPYYGFGLVGLLCVYGLRLLYKGLRDDIYDSFGEENAPRLAYLMFGRFASYQL